MSEREIDFTVDAGESGKRFDLIVARRAGVSRALAARLIEAGAARARGAPADKAARLHEGTPVRVVVPATAAEEPEPEPADVPIRYEDPHLLVVSKPAGVVVHPAPGHTAGTLVNALLARADRPSGGDTVRPGIVHRLDAGTSGLMVVAKTPQAYERLVAMLGARQVVRAYLALVEGVPASGSGTIDAPLGRSPRHRKKMAVVAGGRAALTRYRVLERFDETALLDVRPETGRTHQIRVHLAAIGHPVVGDRVYGRSRALASKLGLDRPFLHAAGLSFDHPVSGEALSFEDPLPQDLLEALRRAREEQI
jgi:23S rRNA pseudouridine1911/1915/1917 synthase